MGKSKYNCDFRTDIGMVGRWQLEEGSSHYSERSLSPCAAPTLCCTHSVLHSLYAALTLCCTHYVLHSLVLHSLVLLTIRTFTNL